MDNQPPQKPQPTYVPVDKQAGLYPDIGAGVPAPAPMPMPMPAPSYVNGQPAPMDQYGRPIVQAIPMAPMQPQLVANNSNIRRDAQGNALCNRCSAPYPLPAGCTSWRCRNCHELNNASVYGDECPCCTIL